MTERAHIPDAWLNGPGPIHLQPPPYHGPRVLGVCVYCGEILDRHNATIDHFVPRSAGGTNSPYNKVPSCKRCNQLKGAMVFTSVRQVRKWLLENGL